VRLVKSHLFDARKHRPEPIVLKQTQAGLPHDFPMSNPDDRDDDRRSDDSFFGRWRGRLAAFDLRDQWWNLLNFLEARRRLRWTLYGVLAALVILASLGPRFYSWWRDRNAISVARQWLAAGRFDHAAQAVQEALAAAPERPEAWAVAADFALRTGKNSDAVTYARRAARLDPENRELALVWAADAVLANLPDEAHKALATLPVTVLENSAYGQRIGGELARRKGDLASARAYFESACRLDGPLAIDEVPLGTVLLSTSDPADRQRGVALLEKWTADRDWGAQTLRTLLADALRRDDRAAMLKWADALRIRPDCTVGDMPNCLLALSKTDEAHFANALASLEKSYASTNPSTAAEFIGWLNQIGRSADALRWAQTLPREGAQHPPVAVAVAEAQRLSGNWTELEAWTKDSDWKSGNLEFLRWLYALEAARKLGQNAHADELWRTLQNHAQLNGVHAVVTADMLYTWGWRDDALSLLWLAADQPGVAIQALGTLARHYQTQRDATGQYHAFRRLYTLRPQDADIGNNFAFFATLTGNEGDLAEQIVRANHNRFPDNLNYLSTYAFVLHVKNRDIEALALLKPVASEWKASSALAFAYGLALAGTDQKAEAHTVLSAIDPATLTTQEVILLKSALN
jgi:cytochrome c-type biogenesis protein CcmH/NrfG